MKYGYMFYQKPMMPKMKTRPVNLGDAIQSYAVKCLYREMGIPEEDIIPVPRYDLEDYDGEECVCVINSASNYEELAYHTHFMPPSKKIHGIPISLHIHREIPEKELEFYRSCGGVGCRDIRTAQYLHSLGIDAYLSGCLTLTFPKRDPETAKKADRVYLIDVSEELEPWIPEEIKRDAVRLTNVERLANPRGGWRMSVEETIEEHRRGEERIDLLRDTARLVVTSKLHIASPCLAMGIPVILAKEHFGDRFGFIDRLLPCYEKENYNQIDWNPQAPDISPIKDRIKQMFFAKVREAASRALLEKEWEQKSPIYPISYESGVSQMLKTIPLPHKPFRYAVWGVILAAAFTLEETMKEDYADAKLAAGIDIAAEGVYCGAPIIRPEEIGSLPLDVIIFVPAPSAHNMAKEILEKQNRPFVLLGGPSGPEWFHL